MTLLVGPQRSIVENDFKSTSQNLNHLLAGLEGDD